MYYVIILSLTLLANTLFGNDESLIQAWNTFLSSSKNAHVITLALESRNENIPRENLENLLNDYTAPTLEQAIMTMLETELQGVDLGKVTLKEIPDREFQEPVFRVLDDHQQCIAIVKGYVDPGMFLGQLSAQEAIYALDLPHVRTTAPIAVGRAIGLNHQLYLLAETVAQGTWFGDIAMEKRYALLPKILKALAQTIAELHLERGRNSSAQEDSDFNWIYCLTKSSIPISYLEADIKRMEDFSEDLQKYVSIDIHSPVYIHGDLHWGNIFYNESKDEITLIDISTLHSRCFRFQYSASAGAASQEFRAAIACMHCFFIETMPIEDFLDLEWEYALAYGNLVSHVKSNVPYDILKVYWKICALWVHLAEEVDVYEETLNSEDPTSSNVEMLSLIETRILRIFQAMEIERFNFEQIKSDYPSLALAG